MRPVGLREFDTWVVDDEWVVRVARRPADATKLDRERLLLGAISLPVEVPEIERWSHGIAVHRKVQGIPADQVAPREEAWPSLAADIGGMLAVLHATDHDIVSEAALEVAVPEPRNRLRQRVAWALGELEREPVPAGVESLADDVAAMPQASSADVVVCYGDFKAEHVLLSQDMTRIAGVIDWADVELRQPEHDFASLVGWLGPRFARLVATRYGCPVDLGAAIVAARAWVVISLAEAVAERDDWPAEPGWSPADRRQAIADRRRHWARAGAAAYDV